MKPKGDHQDGGVNDHNGAKPIGEQPDLDDGDDAILDAMWDRIGAEEANQSKPLRKTRDGDGAAKDLAADDWSSFRPKKDVD